MSELGQLLRKHPRGVTVNEVAAHLQVTPRSARRYLRELRLDLEGVVERPGGEKRWRIPAVDLPRSVALRRIQAYALLATSPLLDLFEGSALHDELSLAQETLIAVARRPGRGPNACGQAEQLEQRFRYAAFAPESSEQLAEQLDMLFHALSEQQAVRCHLALATDSAPKPRYLHPYALLLYKDALHCIAQVLPDGQVCALAVSQLHALRALQDHPFDVPADFRVEDYLQGQFGLWRQQAVRHHIIIALDASVSAVATQRRLHATQRVEPQPDGSVHLHLQLSSTTEVAMWVLGFGSRARVLQPAALREQVATELAAAAAHYST